MNETILLVMAAYGVGVWTAVDRLKPTIKRLFANVPWFNATYQNNAFLVIAFAMAFAILAGDPGTRFFVMIDRVPDNTVWELIDLAITASLVVAGDEVTHRLVDVGRIFWGLKKEAPNV